MPVENIPDASSWFLRKDIVEQQAQEPINPTQEQQNAPAATTKEAAVQPEVKVETPKEEEEEIATPEEEKKPVLPETITQVFETLLSDESGSYGFYKDKKVETLEDVAEFVEINTNHRVQKALQNAEAQWMQTKSPVFQEFAQMAEYVGDDHTKLYDFIQTQQQIDDYTVLDPKDPLQAEVIIENYMRSLGKSKEIIEDEIKDIKELNKLSQRAEDYKPKLVKALETEKKQALEQERLATIEYEKAVSANQQQVFTFLQPDTIAGMRVKDEDKDIIHEDLAFDPDIKGFRIYQKIEQKQKDNDLETLALVSLILNNRPRFNELYGTNIKTAVAKDLRTEIVFGTRTVEGAKDKQPAAAAKTTPTKEEEVKDTNTPWFLQRK